jgi:RNA polymerase sigma factor (sigma-70 family)
VSRSLGLDDNELLDRAIEAHYAEIRAAVRRHGLAGNTASDVVHDLYVKLAEKPGVLRGKRSIVEFLCRAAINLGIDRLRRSRFEQRIFSGTEAEALAVPAAGPSPDHALEVQARLKLLTIAIGELPPRRRAVFILHRLHGLAPDDIGRRLAISRNMVDRHLRKALVHCLDRLHQMG